jgi:hypothetical protein
MATLTRTTAARLLAALLDDGVFSMEGLATRLAVRPGDIADFRDGRQRIPLDRQLQLSAFVIQRVPAYARLAHKLRGQVTAAISFESGATQTHLNDPPLSRRT